MFGSSVALAGDTLVVGAERRSEPILSTGGSINWRAKGAVYVFERNGTGWNEKQKLVANDTTWANDHFGASVAMNGETLVVGAPQRAEDEFQGAVYVFERNGSTWVQRQRILNRVTDCGEYFGASLALAGEVLAIGAPGYGRSIGDACSAVYVFGRDGTMWTERERLTGNTVQEHTYFGASIALQGDTLVVGAMSENLGPIWPDPTWTHFGTGAAYVFVQNGTAWNLQQRLTLAEAMPSHYFGWSLALEGDTLAIGNRCLSGNDLLPGSVHVFRRNGTVWNGEQILKATEGAVADLFGQQIALSGRTLVATSGRGDKTTYVYELDGETWSLWKGLDVGTLSASGGESFANGTFTVTGAGADIWGKGDEFHFVYRQFSGNGEVVGRVTSLEETEGWAKAGVMFRESLDPTARNALAFVTPRNRVVLVE